MSSGSVILCHRRNACNLNYKNLLKECERVTGCSAEKIIGNPDVFELLDPDKEYREQF